MEVGSTQARSVTAQPDNEPACVTDRNLVIESFSLGGPDTCVWSKVFFPDRLTQTVGHRFRFTGPVGPVTGGNRLNSNSNSNSNKFKSFRATGSNRFTGRFDRFTGRFYRFEFKSKFKSSRAIGLPDGLSGGP